MPLSRQAKKDAVARIAADLKKYPVIGLASLQNLPSRQLNTIRTKLRGKAVFEITRSSLLKRAIAQARPELTPMAEGFQGSTALIATDMDPFKLYKVIKAAKSKAAAKPGQISPVEIVVQAGETNLPPGPVLSELKAVKLDARIQGPKIVIGKDAIVAKKGDVISSQLAAVLTKLNIRPMEIGLNVVSVTEGPTTYPGAILNIDQDKFMADLGNSAIRGINLAVFTEYFTPQTIQPILAQAARSGMGLQKVTSAKEPAKPAEHEKPADAAVEATPTPAAA